MPTSILWAHHIIPEHCAGLPALEGVDINAPANIVYLPASRHLADEMGVSPHSGGHLQSYYAACDELDGIAEISEPALRLKAIEDLQDAMRIALANGDLFTNKPGTGADAVSLNKSLLAGRGKYLVDHLEEHEKIRELRQRGAATGQSHLIKWSPYWGNPDREEQLTRAISKNPGLNLTAGNKDLDGTPWSKFAAIDPTSNIFRIPGLPPASPSDFPSLPGYNSPSFAGLNEPEGLTRIDPRFTGVLPAFPALSPDEQRLGQLPPTTATPSDPLVLRFDLATGAPLPFSERSPILDPDPPAGGTPPNALYGVAALTALMVVAPEFAPLWGALGAAGLVGATSARGTGAESGAGGVFSAGTTPYNTFNSNNPAPQRSASNSLWCAPGSQAENNTHDQESERASTFVDRFGNWTDTPAGTVPAQDPPAAPPTPAAGAVAPEEVRRLTRVNASNAGSVFTSGSAPVPYLPSTDFNDRFGNWTMPTADGRPPRTSRPIGAFADEPSYLIPPPIFGADDPDNPHSDAEKWFSRWIRPLLPLQ